MRIEITAAESPDEFALTALADWLRRDPDVRRGAVVGQRGTKVTVDLEHTGVVSAVLVAYADWRRTRQDAPVVTVVVRGVPVRMEQVGPETAAWIVALLEVEVSV